MREPVPVIIESPVLRQILSNPIIRVLEVGIFFFSNLKFSGMPDSAIEICRIGGCGMEHLVVKHIGYNRFRHSRFIEDTTNGYRMVRGVEVPEYAPTFF